MTDDMSERGAKAMAAGDGRKWEVMFDRHSVKYDTLAVRPWWLDRAEEAYAALTPADLATLSRKFSREEFSELWGLIVGESNRRWNEADRTKGGEDG